jgi:hypothetical protein
MFDRMYVTYPTSSMLTHIIVYRPTKYLTLNGEDIDVNFLNLYVI